MSWQVKIAKRVVKQLKRIPAKDNAFIVSALEGMAKNPYSGDIEKIAGEDHTWRRRVGNYRILYEIDTGVKILSVYDVRRRTTTTYRKR